MNPISPSADSKVCSRCSLELSTTEFHKSSKTRDGRHRWCKKCANAWRREYYARDEVYRRKVRAKNRHCYFKNKVGHNRRARASEIKRTYGITFDDYQRIFQEQGERCGLCQRTEPMGRGDWHIDHCHKSGRIRGVLCHHCNMRLGVYETILEEFGREKLEEYISRDVCPAK